MNHRPTLPLALAAVLTIASARATTFSPPLLSFTVDRDGRRRGGKRPKKQRGKFVGKRRK